MLAMKMITLVLGVANFALGAAAATAPAQSLSLPQFTAIPVRFVRTLDARTAKAGDTVTAKTMQVILLPNGDRIARGTLLTGHVVAAVPFHFDPAPYTHQQSSLLSIEFDTLRRDGETIPVSLTLRALANAIDSRDATYAHSSDDTDHVGVVTLIGGLSFSPLDKTIESADGDAVAYHRKDGVFARLIAAEGNGASIACVGTDSEQSVAIFSPDACGLYGFAGDSLSQNGDAFTIAVRGHSAKLNAGTTALLQVHAAQ